VRREIDPKLDVILSPDWSADGRWLAFAGTKAGRQDLYLWDLRAGVLHQLNDDPFADGHPVFSPDGMRLAFESDRAAGDKRGGSAFDVWVVSLDTARGAIAGAPERMTQTPWDSKAPDWVNDSLLAFESNRSGFPNLYVQELTSGRVSVATDVLSAAFTPSFSVANGRMAFALFEGGGWDIFLADKPLAHLRPLDSVDGMLPDSLQSLYVRKATGQELHPLAADYFSPLPFENLNSLRDTLPSDSSVEWRSSSLMDTVAIRGGGGGTTSATSLMVAGSSSPRQPIDSATWAALVDSSFGKAALRQPVDSATWVALVDSSSGKPAATAADSLKNRSTPPAQKKSGERAKNDERPKNNDRPPLQEDPWSDDPFARPTSRRDAFDEEFARAQAERAMAEDSFAVDTSAFIHDGKLLKDSAGNYRVTPYRAQWSLDQAVAAAGAATTGSGMSFGGQAFLTFSDLTGDQKITAMLYSGGGGFDEVNAYMAYQLLPWRMDMAARAWHQTWLTSDSIRMDTTGRVLYGDRWADGVFVEPIPSQLVLYPDGSVDTLYADGCVFTEGNSQDTTWGLRADGTCSRWEAYRDRVMGVGTTFSWPFNRFLRTQVDLDLERITRTRMEWNGNEWAERGDSDPREIDRVQINWSWSFDNARWGIVGPESGGRSGVALGAVPPWQDKVGYWTAESDLRRYWLLGQRYTIALRSSAGVSYDFDGSENPQRWMVGGEPFTFNYHISSAQREGTFSERWSSQMETPLRGFDTYDFVGTRKAVTNLEFRFPAIEELRFGLLLPPIRQVMGSFFVDYGGAWDQGEWAFDEMGLGWGWGLRLNLGIFVLRWSQAWTADGIGAVDHRGSRQIWGIGAEF
jgi:hypothetical protein